MLGFSVAPSISLQKSCSPFFGARLVCAVHQQANYSPGSTNEKRLIVRCGRKGGGGRDFRRRGDGRRPNRVAELIRREISPIIDDAFARTFRKNERDPPLFVSVVDVRCSEDLRNAKVGISVLGTDEQKDSTLQWLRGAKKEIRFALAQCVYLKHIPELSFIESEVAQAVETVNILNMLAKEREEKQTLAAAKVGSGVEAVESELPSFASSGDLDLDASAEDAILFDDLEGLNDDDDDDEKQPHIVEVTDDGEEYESMSDEKLRRALFKTLETEDFVR